MKSVRAVGLGRLRRADLVQLGAAIVLVTTLLLGWYSTDGSNPNSAISGERGSVSAWDAHATLPWVLVAAFVAALMSAWQTVRAQRTDWRRGEMSMVFAVVMTGLILIQGLLDRPGDPASTIGLDLGWFVALAASLVATTAAVHRLPSPTRTPPGV